MSRTPAAIAFCAIRSEGGLLPHDILQRIAFEDTTLSGLSPESYHLDAGERFHDAVNRAWSRLTVAWRGFQATLAKLPGSDPATAVTRERWLLPLFDALGYGRLAEAPALEIEGKAYAISHAYHKSPIHLLGCRVDLDTKQKSIAGTAAASPHGLVQDFLNRSDGHLWGFVCNGHVLRVLRDHHSLTQQAYVEFDLQAILEGEAFSEFFVLWLLCHHSRIEAEHPCDCWLEKWFQVARTEGVRALEKLREGVENAIKALGTGFLRHKANRQLFDALAAGHLDKQDYYRQLLRLVYRLIFLFVAEDRGALLNPIPKATEAARARYERFYTTRRLRDLAGKRRGSRHGDLWHQLRLVMSKLHDGSPELALPALGSFLWQRESIRGLNDIELANEDLLQALRALCDVEHGKTRYAVSFRNIGAEELGSVYESLLELHPEIHKEPARFELNTASGHERKTTGSYYTPIALVDCLLDSALDPVLDEAAHNPDPEHAILGLKVCDPACGSGHFLVAAARRIALRLATVRSGGDEPSPPELQRALRDVVGRCIYGVDVNPMAVELCKVSLWMEAIEPGKPLSFLENHIRQGNALLGTTPALMAQGIPDEAFEPIEGDDKEVARRLKKRNKKARKSGRPGLDAMAKGAAENDHGRIATAAGRMAQDKKDDIGAVREKEDDWQQVIRSADYQKALLLADAWCATFMWPKQKGRFEDGAITEDRWRQMEKNTDLVPEATMMELRKIVQQYSFFHWHLAFPQVFGKPIDPEVENEAAGWSRGFDVMLGNPPWISHAGRAAQPLPPAVSKFFACTSPAFAGYRTTHGMFVWRAAQCLRPHGRLGLVIPTSISDLAGYQPARRAHDRMCEVITPLRDFGDGAFEGVFQPCMALISVRKPGGRSEGAPGARWDLDRADMAPGAAALLARLKALPPLPPELFGERGFQTTAEVRELLVETGVPAPVLDTALREGGDIKEFHLGKPRLWATRAALGTRLRPAAEYAQVAIVLRQTARYPIATANDGLAFRNSLLACFAHGRWTRGLLLCLLNSSLVRWFHYHEFRDARQGMPQVKIGHLRGIPAPAALTEAVRAELDALGDTLTARNAGIDADERARMDTLVFGMYNLTDSEQAIVSSWAASMPR